MSLEGVGQIKKTEVSENEGASSGKLLKRSGSNLESSSAHELPDSFLRSDSHDFELPGEHQVKTIEPLGQKKSVLNDENELDVSEINLLPDPVIVPEKKSIVTQIKELPTDGLTKAEKKEHRTLLDLVNGNKDLRTTMQDLEKIINDSKTPVIKELAINYREQVSHLVFSDMSLNALNISDFVDSFKKATEHKKFFGDGNKNIKSLYSALDNLKTVVLDNDGDSGKKIEAMNKVKELALDFISKNKSSSKLGWVKGLDSFLTVEIAKETSLLEKVTALANSRREQPFFAAEAKKLGKAFEILNQFDAKFSLEMNFSRAENKPIKEQALLRELGNRLGKMDNNDFLSLYKKVSSTDMTEFRLKLLNSGNAGNSTAELMLESLNNLEAMVYIELAERTARNQDNPVAGKLSDGQMAILAESETVASKRELNFQTDNALKGQEAFNPEEQAAVQRLEKFGITVQQLTDAFKSSDLTINLSSSRFLDSDSPLFNRDGSVNKSNSQIKNIFKIAEDDPDWAMIKGPLYTERRRVAEVLEFPVLEKLDSERINPANHPVSAALNVGKKVDGAAGGYGRLVLVAKDDVKERATYTPLDSFYTNKIQITAENMSAFKNTLADKLSDTTNFPEMNKRLDYLVGSSFSPSTKNNFLDVITSGLDDLLEDDDVALMRIEALKHFSDQSVTGNLGTTFGKISHLINNLNDEQLAEVAKGIKDKDRINLKIGNNLDYVEAQVHGGIDFAKDLKEIRIVSSSAEEIARARTLAESFNVPLIVVNTTETNKQLSNEDLTSYKKIPASDGLINQENKFREKELFSILDKYKEHEASFDPTGFHGRRHISRAVIYSNILANVFSEKGADINTSLIFRATAFHDAGRTKNGADTEEDKSAKQLTDYFTEKGLTDPEYLKMATACIDHNAPAGSDSFEMGILKSADSLDIGRTKDYDPKFLWFMKNDLKLPDGGHLKADPELREKIITEALALTAETDPLFALREVRMLKMEVLNQQINPEEPLSENVTLGLQKVLGASFSELSALTGNEKLDKAMELLTQKEKVVNTEITSANELSSQAIFQSIEAKLLSGKYPTLQKYYDSDFKFSLPKIGEDQKKLEAEKISTTLQKMEKLPVSKKLGELNDLQAQVASPENKKLVTELIDRLVQDSLKGGFASKEFSKDFRLATENKLINVYRALEKFEQLNTSRGTTKIELLSALNDLGDLAKKTGGNFSDDPALSAWTKVLGERIEKERQKIIPGMIERIPHITEINPSFEAAERALGDLAIAITRSNKENPAQAIMKFSALYNIKLPEKLLYQKDSSDSLNGSLACKILNKITLSNSSDVNNIVGFLKANLTFPPVKAEDKELVNYIFKTSSINSSPNREIKSELMAKLFENDLLPFGAIFGERIDATQIFSAEVRALKPEEFVAIKAMPDTQSVLLSAFLVNNHERFPQLDKEDKEILLRSIFLKNKELIPVEKAGHLHDLFETNKGLELDLATMNSADELLYLGGYLPYANLYNKDSDFRDFYNFSAQFVAKLEDYGLTTDSNFLDDSLKISRSFKKELDSVKTAENKETAFVSLMSKMGWESKYTEDFKNIGNAPSPEQKEVEYKKLRGKIMQDYQLPNNDQGKADAEAMIYKFYPALICQNYLNAN